MVDRVGVHALDHAHIVDHLGQVSLRFAEPDARLAVACEPDRAGSDRERLLARRHRRLAFVGIHRLGHLLTKPLGQLRLVVEQVHLGRAAGLEQIDDSLGLGGKVRQIGKATGGIPRSAREADWAVVVELVVSVDQRSQRDGTQAQRALFEPRSASLLRNELVEWSHVNSG